jgi:hypothetical protein
MGMPEAAVDKDSPLLALVGQVRIARKAFYVVAEADAGGMDKGPHKHLGGGVLRANSRHDLGVRQGCSMRSRE